MNIKIKDEKNIICKLVCLVLLFFGTNIYFSLSTDTYYALQNGFDDVAKDMFSRNGRPIIAFIYEFFYIIKIPYTYFYYISTALALIFLVLSLWIIQKKLADLAISENRRIVISCALIINIFIVEYFMFLEKCGFAFAIFITTVGVFNICKFFENKNKFNYICALICVVCAIFTYQGIISLFVIICIPFAYKNSENLKRYILRLIEIGSIYAIAIVLDMLAFKYIFKSARLETNQNYLTNFVAMIKELKNVLLESFNILPKYLFSIVIFAMVCIDILIVLKRKNKIYGLVNIVTILIVSVVFPTATIIQGSGWMAMRIIYPLASIIGVLATDIFINCSGAINDGYKNTNSFFNIQHLKAFVIVIMLGLSVVQYCSFNSIYIDKYKLNYADKNRAIYIGEEIKKYQDITGEVIKKVAFYYDTTIRYPYYPDLYCNGDMLVSSFNTYWSDANALSFYLGNTYERVEQEKKYIEYFSDKNWDSFSNEQLLFDKDTLHICIY